MVFKLRLIGIAALLLAQMSLPVFANNLTATVVSVALTYPSGIAYLPICPDWGIWLISETRQKCVSIVISS